MHFVAQMLKTGVATSSTISVKVRGSSTKKLGSATVAINNATTTVNVSNVSSLSATTTDNQATDAATEVSEDSSTFPQQACNNNILDFYPKVCRNREQFEAWQRTRNWLIFDCVVRSVKCSICSQVKRLGLHNAPGQHNEAAFMDWSDRTVLGKDAKTLLKKIDKHRDSTSHHTCSEIVAKRKKDDIVAAAKSAEARYFEQNREKIIVTVKVFRTAYECAKSHLPCTEHPRLIQLQTLNGIECGKILYSNHACSNIIHHVADEMLTEIITHIKTSECKFSILVDESTSVANVQSMIVYLRTQFAGEICTYFLTLLQLTDATAEGLKETLVEFLHASGLDDEIVSTICWFL